MPLKHLDLFSGIGGFALGLSWAGGFETVAFSECDSFCQRVLRKHWPDTPIYDNVETIDYDGSVDIITGGYPCQPFSNERQHSGQRTGKEDSRWLWHEVSRLMEQYRPTWFIGENVTNHISMGLDEVLSDLESQGYTAQAFIIPALAVGQEHRRERLWIIANSDGQRRECLDYELEKRCSAINLQGMEQRDIHRPHNLSVSVERRYDKPSSGIQRNDNGLSKGMDRLKGLGNAVVPQIPMILGQAIQETEQ